jgi:hypothetical protein
MPVPATRSLFITFVSFVVLNDTRTMRANHRHCYGKKANFSASFTFDKLSCNTCNFGGEHLVLHREVDGTDTLDASPVCFVLSDQCFPPFIPVEGDGECLKILQIEDSTLGELVEAFLDLTKGFLVPAGSVAVLASASHMARVGTAAYAVDFVKARGRLVSVMGGGIELVHGIPILLSGTDDCALIRSIADFSHWLEGTSTGRDIVRARRAFIEQTFGNSITAFGVDGCAGTHYAPVSRPLTDTPEASACTGTPEAPVAHMPMSMVLPSDLDGRGYTTYRSPGYTALPKSVPPCTADRERALVDALIEDLNSTFMCNLATEYGTGREGHEPNEDDSISSSTRYIFVGASHASRIASAMREAGAEVADISVPGWTISEANVESSAALLREILDEPWDGDTVIMYQLFDNTTFYCVSADGSAVLPKKSREDGKYHIVGALRLVDRDTFKQLFSVAVSLLRAGGQHKKVIITPLMRYAAENCCDDPAHCTNRGGNLNTILSEGLSTIETWIDDQVYLKRIRNFHVVNPNDIITPDGSTKRDTRTFKTYWRAGPVHMTCTGYDRLAKGILEDVASATFKRSDPQPPSTNPQPPPIRGRGRARGRIDLSCRRQGWVSGNDTVAHRNYTEQTRGAGGSRGNRGQWRGRGRGHKREGKPYYGSKFMPYGRK